MLFETLIDFYAGITLILPKTVFLPSGLLLMNLMKRMLLRMTVFDTPHKKMRMRVLDIEIISFDFQSYTVLFGTYLRYVKKEREREESSILIHLIQLRSNSSRKVQRPPTFLGLRQLTKNSVGQG